VIVSFRASLVVGIISYNGWIVERILDKKKSANEVEVIFDWVIKRYLDFH